MKNISKETISQMDKIEKLNGYTFDWLEEYSEDRTRQIGMIADEVYDVQPELISKRTMLLGGKEEEIKLLDYAKVNALLHSLSILFISILRSTIYLITSIL